MSLRQERQIQTRESLLQAAIEVFSERGYQGATMEEIARRAGVAKGTTYLHFADKADLFYAVFEQWTGDALAASEPALAAAGSASEQLKALAISAVDFIQAHRQWFPLTLEVWSASGTPVLRDRFAAALGSLYAGYRSGIASIIQTGLDRGEFREDVDAEALAALLTGAVDGLFLQCWFDPELEAKRLLNGFFDVLIRGMQNPGQGDKQ